MLTATPQLQREIEAVVARLATFHPTRVAVEWPADEQAVLDQRYADYRAGHYVLSADEVDRIGLRLAARLDLHRVDAVNWNDAPPGNNSDYDFSAWADAHGHGADWQAFKQQGLNRAAAQSRVMMCTPVSAWLRHLTSRTSQPVQSTR